MDALREGGSSEPKLRNFTAAQRSLCKHSDRNWIVNVKLIIIELHDRIVPGCSREFFASTSQYKFEEYRKGENFFLLRK